MFCVRTVEGFGYGYLTAQSVPWISMEGNVKK
jgi:hypothetical protein